MNYTPLKYYASEIDKLFFIPIPALTIDKSYRSCPYNDYNIYLCTNIDCNECLRNIKNVKFLEDYNKLK